MTVTPRGPHIFKRQWQGRESRWYYLSYYAPGPGGRKRRVVRRTDPPTDSKRAATEQLHAALGGTPARKPPQTVDIVMAQYGEHLEASSPSTWRRCGSRVRWWSARYGDWSPGQLTRLEVERAIAELRRTHADSTVYGYVVILKAAFRRARLTHDVCTMSIALPRPIRASVWTDDEIRRLCVALDAFTPWASPLVRLLRETGIRIGDALALRWDEITEDVLRRVQQKTGEELHIPLSAAAVAILDGIPRAGPLVFPGINEPHRPLHKQTLRYQRFGNPGQR